MKVKYIAACAAVLLLASVLNLSAGGRKEEKSMISLNMLTNGVSVASEAGGDGGNVFEATFLPGQLLSYTFELYASVGFDADYSVSDETVLSFVERKEKYFNQKRMRQGMTGADDAEGTFVFKAVKSGRATLVIRHLFRGDVEKELTFNITVE